MEVLLNPPIEVGSTLWTVFLTLLIIAMIYASKDKKDE